MKSLTTFALIVAAHMLLLMTSISAATVPCSSPNGARFNLEARANALPQGAGAVDFLPNRLGGGGDLIVEHGNEDLAPLLDPKACPHGTHSAAQSPSCWTVSPPVLLFPVPGAFAGGVFSIAVD